MAPSAPLGSATGQTLKFVSYIELKLRKSNKKTQAMKVQLRKTLTVEILFG